jgi:hypothetical protein
LRGDLWRMARLLARRGQGHAPSQGDLRATVPADLHLDVIVIRDVKRFAGVEGNANAQGGPV